MTHLLGAEGVLHKVSDYRLKKAIRSMSLFMPRKYGHWQDGDYPSLHLVYGGGLVKQVSNLIALRKIHFDFSYSLLVDLAGILGLLRRLHILHK